MTGVTAPVAVLVATAALAERKRRVEREKRSSACPTRDRFSTESGERAVVGRPYSSAGGKMVHARVQHVGNPARTTLWAWEAHERIAVKRPA